MRVARNPQHLPSHGPPERRLDIRMSLNERRVVDGSVQPLVNSKCLQSLREFVISPRHHISLLTLSLLDYRWDTALRPINKSNVLFIRDRTVILWDL